MGNSYPNATDPSGMDPLTPSQQYLVNYPEVAAALASGEAQQQKWFNTPYEHYQNYGKKQGFIWPAAEDKGYFGQINLNLSFTQKVILSFVPGGTVATGAVPAVVNPVATIANGAVALGEQKVEEIKNVLNGDTKAISNSGLAFTTTTLNSIQTAVAPQFNGARKLFGIGGDRANQIAEQLDPAAASRGRIYAAGQIEAAELATPGGPVAKEAQAALGVVRRSIPALERLLARIQPGRSGNNIRSIIDSAKPKPFKPVTVEIEVNGSGSIAAPNNVVDFGPNSVRTAMSVPSTPENISRLYATGAEPYGAEQLAKLGRYLDRRGVDLVLDARAVGGRFSVTTNGRPQFVVNANVRKEVVWHELGHFLQWKQIGTGKYLALPRVPGNNVPEQFVFDLLQQPSRWERLSPEYRLLSESYITEEWPRGWGGMGR